jgi:hypothetical protein
MRGFQETADLCGRGRINRVRQYSLRKCPAGGCTLPNLYYRPMSGCHVPQVRRYGLCQPLGGVWLPDRLSNIGDDRYRWQRLPGLAGPSTASPLCRASPDQREASARRGAPRCSQDEILRRRCAPLFLRRLRTFPSGPVDKRVRQFVSPLLLRLTALVFPLRRCQRLARFLGKPRFPQPSGLCFVLLSFGFDDCASGDVGLFIPRYLRLPFHSLQPDLHKAHGLGTGGPLELLGRPCALGGNRASAPQTIQPLCQPTSIHFVERTMFPTFRAGRASNRQPRWSAFRGPVSLTAGPFQF